MEQMGSAMFPVLHDMETEDTQNMQGTEVLEGKTTTRHPPPRPSIAYKTKPPPKT